MTWSPPSCGGAPVGRQPLNDLVAAELRRRTRMLRATPEHSLSVDALAFAVLDLTGSVRDLGLVVGARSVANGLSCSSAAWSRTACPVS